MLSTPFCQSKFTFVTIGLDAHKEVDLIRDVSIVGIFKENIVDVYARRSEYAQIYEGLSRMSLATFASNYYIKTVHGQKTLAKSLKPAIVRTFPHISSNPAASTYGEYCKFRLIKWKPWAGIVDIAWQDFIASEGEAQDYTFIATWTSFFCERGLTDGDLDTYSWELDAVHEAGHGDPIGESIEAIGTTAIGPNFLEDLEDGSSNDEYGVIVGDTSSEDWMQLCANVALQAAEPPPYAWSCDADWSLPQSRYHPDKVDQMATWLIHTKAQAANDIVLGEATKWTSTDMDLLSANDQQFTAYYIVRDHYDVVRASASLSISSGHPDVRPHPQPLYMLICGTAGTGKSFLIRALSALLGDSCILTATTGKAAILIGGCTIHSVAALPIGSPSDEMLLQGARKAKLQPTFAGKRYVIIDEV